MTRGAAAATAAAAISVAAHPLLLTPLTVAIVSRNWRWSLLLFAASSVPLTLLIARDVRRGSFSDFDVSDRRQRPRLYLFGFPVLALVAAVMHFAGAPPSFLRAAAAFAVVFAIGVAANRWLKISLHMIFAAFNAVLLGRVYPSWTLAALVLVAAVGWSRWRLTRHTIPEILIGTVLGTLAALYTIR